MTTAYVAVDWGTSSFRLWVVADNGEVLGESRGPEGMIHCAEHGFEPVLDRHLAAAAGEGLPVIVCGMAGARQGWVEAPYCPVPTVLDELHQKAVRVPARGDIRILPGLCQSSVDAPNVMRGEETQLLGLPPASGNRLICMPGTHCKWVRMDGAQVLEFESYMTGELFAVLSRHSVLRHSLSYETKVGPDTPAFLDALDATLGNPQGVLSRLFEVRAGQLLGYADAGNGAAYLSGLLIGAEVGAALGTFRGEVMLVGAGGLGALYSSAITRAGARVQIMEAEVATRKGLAIAGSRIWGNMK